MTSVLEYITNNPQETKRLVGIDYNLLQQLITQAVALEEQNIVLNEKGKIRIIKPGGGSQPKLSATEQILLTLVYQHPSANIPNARSAIWGE